MLHTRRDAGVSAQTVNLCPARHAGTYLVLHHVEGHRFPEALHVVGNLRSRTYEAHGSRKHIPQLGKLVDAYLAEKGTQPRTPVVLG